MSSAPDGANRQTRAAYLRWEGKSFAFIAVGLGYRSADEAEADYKAFMDARRIRARPTERPCFIRSEGEPTARGAS